MTNWAGNVTYSASHIHRPATLARLQEVVAASERIRALGTGHSFNRVADSTGALVSLAALPAMMDIDSARSTVTVAAGVRYGELARHLHANGVALANLASLPHISVGGACATGTHGSGARNGGLASSVRRLDMIRADGELVALSRSGEGDAFCGAVVALGALGVVTTLALDVVPSFDVAQYVYDGLPRQRLLSHVDEILEAGYSVSVFTEWGEAMDAQVWLKRRVDDAEPPPGRRWMGASLATAARHPVPGMPATNCTEQLGAPGPWHERLPHFRLDFTPSSGEELQAEYVVPRDRAGDALAAVEAIRDRIRPVLQISEIRAVASDALWLSPFHGRDSVAIHFTWVADAEAVTPVLMALERQLAPYRARPHWGKLFMTAPDVLSGLYERWPDFLRLRDRLDPAGKFGNEFTRTYLRSEDTTRR